MGSLRRLWCRLVGHRWGLWLKATQFGYDSENQLITMIPSEPLAAVAPEATQNLC